MYISWPGLIIIAIFMVLSLRTKTPEEKLQDTMAEFLDVLKKG